MRLATTRTSHGKTARSCCSLSPSLPVRARVTRLIGRGNATVQAGSGPLLHRRRPHRSSLPWPGSDTVGKIIDTSLCADLVILDEIGFAPLDGTGTQLWFRLVAACYERRSPAIASHWPFDQWGRFLPEHTTAASILDRLLRHATIVVTSGESYRMRHDDREKEAAKRVTNHPQRVGRSLAISGDFYMAINTYWVDHSTAGS